MEEDEDQERVREKFKRERDDEAAKEINLKRDRIPSPTDARGRKREKYDDFGRISRENREGSPDPQKERERSPPRDRSRERFPERDSYRPPSRGYRRNYRDVSPDRGRGRRESPPPFKRRRREDEWESPRGGDRYSDRGRRGRTWSGDSDSERSKMPRQGLFEGSVKTYKQFLELQDDSITPEQGERKYEEYKEEFKKRQAKTFFEEHKNDEWFKEKYEPTFTARRRVERIESSKKNFQSFLDDLNSGKDFNLNAEDHPEFANKDDKQEMQLEEGETEHPLEEGHEEAREEGETKQEEEKVEEDKKLAALKSARPRQSEKLEQGMDARSSRNEGPSTTLFIKTVPPSTGKADLLQLFGGTVGFQFLSLSEPMRFKNFHRIGWATYDTPEHCSKALSELNGRKLKEFDLMLAINKQTGEKRAKITPPVASEEARITIDLEMTKKLCSQLDHEKDIEGNPLLSGEPSVKLLDQRIAYLRRVHFMCYYCGEEYDDEEDLKRRCGHKHLRGRNKEADKQIDASADTWANSLDQKTKHRIENPDNPDAYTGKNALDAATEDFFASQTTKIGDDKFRCALCSKLFAADHFVRKHLQLKHETDIAESKKQALERQCFENYLADPKRIVPAPQGNFPSPISRGGSERRDQRPGGRYSWPPPTDRYDRGGGYDRGYDRGGGYDRGYDRGGYDRGGFGGRGRGFGGRGRGIPGRGRPYGDRPRMDPPPGVAPDPRALREYVDLDAPEDEPVAIDYRTSLPEPEREEKDD